MSVSGYGIWLMSWSLISQQSQQREVWYCSALKTQLNSDHQDVSQSKFSYLGVTHSFNVCTVFRIAVDMNEDKHAITDELLMLSLQIMCLLTGEDYTVVKKHGEPVMDSENPSASDETSTSIDIPSINLENKLMVEKLVDIAYKIRYELEEFSETSGLLEETCEGNTQPKDISEHLTNLFNLVNKMTKDKNQMIGNIVTHTLELLYLLIGEDHIVVKKYAKVTNNNPASEDDRNSMLSERSKVKKILEFTNKIIKLVTGKITVKTEDAEVYSTMEEYLKGYREFFKDVTMDREHNRETVALELLTSYPRWQQS